MTFYSISRHAFVRHDLNAQITRKSRYSTVSGERGKTDPEETFFFSYIFISWQHVCTMSLITGTHNTLAGQYLIICIYNVPF